MTVVSTLVRRNIKLFFKDKGLFFTALITPAILLVLYATFLRNVYRDSFVALLTDPLPDAALIDGLVSGQLVSSLLAVCCVTVAFCANFLMVQDRANGTIKDLRVSPVSPSALSLAYYLSALLSTLLICLVAAALCLGYLAFTGWYLSVSDVLALLGDVVLLSLFGTALSSVINFFLSSQGQISAVGSIVSSGYGFICGAYMPLSSFSEGLRQVLHFLPGTYATALLRNHAMQGALEGMRQQGVSPSLLQSLRDTVDCNLYFFGSRVPIGAMYAVLGGTVAVLIAVYLWLNYMRNKKIK